MEGGKDGGTVVSGGKMSSVGGGYAIRCDEGQTFQSQYLGLIVM